MFAFVLICTSTPGPPSAAANRLCYIIDEPSAALADQTSIFLFKNHLAAAPSALTGASTRPFHVPQLHLTAKMKLLPRDFLPGNKSQDTQTGGVARATSASTEHRFQPSSSGSQTSVVNTGPSRAVLAVILALLAFTDASPRMSLLR